jgi:hypothetical protein
MSWELGKAECATNLDSLADIGYRRSSGDGCEEKSTAASSFCIRRTANLIALGALSFVCWNSEVSRAQGLDSVKTLYVRAVEQCRGDVKRPMALAVDKRILCFDGEISSGLDISSAMDLQDGGFFVVRAFGNDVVTAIALADLLRERHATIVVHDYCVFACASYLLVASARTFVLKDSLVAWRHFGAGPNDCAGFARAKDEGPARLEVGVCPNPPLEFRSETGELDHVKEQFYGERFVDSRFEFPPESFNMRGILKSLVNGTGAYPNVMWTWNPRYYASSIKTNIAYEAYPQSQSEVDAVATRLHLMYRVIYDP